MDYPAVADLGGASSGSKFLHFHAIFGEHWVKGEIRPNDITFATWKGLIDLYKYHSHH